MNNTDSPIQFLKGVGPGRASQLNKLGINTVGDLLYYFPRVWEDRRLSGQLPDLSWGPLAASAPPCGGVADALPGLAAPPDREMIRRPAVFFGRVADTGLTRTRTALGIFTAAIADGRGNTIDACWYKKHNYRYDVFSSLKRDIREGIPVWVIGRMECDKFGPGKFMVDEYYPAEEKSRLEIHVNRIVPVYPLTEGVSGRLLRELSFNALKLNEKNLVEIIPQVILAKRKLLNISQALWGVHFPDSRAELDAARKRLIYEEFLLLTLAWAIKHRQTHELSKGFGYEIKKSLLTPFREKMGFDFTVSQKRVINEIFADMRSPAPMTRLLQGDVGSGKTVVALSAMLLAAENGYQSAFMAPTEILAEQHFMTIGNFLKGLPVRFELLTSKTKPAEREKILEKARSGGLDILLGTHSIIEENVEFSRLRLAVIDEQHRFGVRQRALLRQKGVASDLLVMTATPIPRTLALALYGDLDVSTLSELPPGRLPVKTLHVPEEQAFQAAREEAAKGRQVYIVYPLIEESETKTWKSVKAEFQRLKEKVFPGLRVEVIHGQMPGKKKTEIMGRFLAGEIDILAATPVIEVGVDVANASLMIIQSADRFGLASLHQLRGRVGRGRHESACLLVAEAATPEARERIGIMCRTNDGFVIGEKDMAMRGPGELLGTQQSGMISLAIGDLLSDAEILRWAMEDRQELLARDPNLEGPGAGPLRRRLVELYQKKWHLIDLS